MAEAILSVTIDKISSLLINEARFLSNVEQDFGRLQSELERMQCFLRDADCSQDRDERVRNWVTQIRDIAYDAEDVIDEFLLKIPREEVGFRRCRWILKLLRGPQLHGIGRQINSITARIGDIYRSMQMSGIKLGKAEGSTSTSEMRQRVRRTDPNEEDEHVIQLQSATRDVLAQLMKQDKELRVVSIVGMGGLGKTTLAKQLYNRNDVKNHFDCYSWVFLSQQFSPMDVFLQIFEDVGRSTEMQEEEKLINALKQKLYAKRDRDEWIRMEEEEFVTALKDALNDQKRYLERMDEVLIKTLRYELRATREEKLMKALYNALKEKRYLVVIDDIWKKEAWDSLKRAFPNGKTGSKVLFTTRSKEVALYANPWSSPVEPRFLTVEEGWELLSKKSLPRETVANRSYPPQLETMGKEMVRKLEGLPLAISVLGGLLANKPMTFWEKVQKDINSQFMKIQKQNQYAGVEWILGLSYDDLPYNLRPCFLYLSQFPEDSEFHKKRLIRMWIAEGFIPEPVKENEAETMEDMGEEYLEELVSRSMVQVSERDHTGIGIKKCRMHDLMREMCVSKAIEENFLQVLGNDYWQVRWSKPRRIAVSNVDFRITKVDPRIRSLLTSHTQASTELDRVIHLFKLLRVLHIENERIIETGISPEIGQLIHLRYLGFRNIRYYSMPASIANLKSLYTLDLRNANAVRIPDVLWKLEFLRHLLISRTVTGEFRLDTLKALETLKWVTAQNLVRKNAMLQLTNLRHLQIIIERRDEFEAVLGSPIFNNQGRLRSLAMWSITSSFPNLEPLQACHLLTKVLLVGVIPQARFDKELPASLTKLELRDSKLDQDPMDVLEKLPSIRILILGEESYVGFEMVCSAHGFPKLEIIELASLRNLQEWKVEEGAMLCLKTVFLKSLPELRRIPVGFKFLNKLRNLELVRMPWRFETRVRIIDGKRGEDYDQVSHIPSVTVR